MIGFVVKRSTSEESICEFLKEHACVSFEVRGESGITIEILESFVEVFTRNAHWNGRVSSFDSIDKKLIKDRMNPSEDEMDIIRKIMRAAGKRYSTAA